MSAVSPSFHDLRSDQPAGIAVVLFDIRRHVVTVGGTEPTLDEARRLYARWFQVSLDDDGQPPLL